MFADQLGEFDFTFSRRAEAGTDFQRLFYGLDDRGVAMPKE